MIAEALKAPARSSDLVPTVVIGGLLVALSVLFPAVTVAAAVQVNPIALVALPVALLPALVFAGYELRVAAAGASEERAVPSFVDWGGLARGGVGVVVLTLWYLLPLVAVVAAGLAALTGFLGDAGTIPRSPAGASASVLATAGLGALYVAVFAYGWPAAMATYAVTGRLRSAMNPRRVGGVALSVRYPIGWLAGALVLAVPGVIALALSSVLIGLPLLFYVLAAVASLFGRASGRQLGAGLAEEIRPDHETIPEPEPEATVQTGRPLDAVQTGADTDAASDDRGVDDGADDETGEEQPSGTDTDTDAETGPDVAPDAEPGTGGDSPATAGTSPEAEPGTAAGADATTVTGAAASDPGEGGEPAAGESDVATGADGAASGATAGEHPGLDFGSDGSVDGESSSTEDGIDFGSAPSSESSVPDDSADGTEEVSGPSTPDDDGVSASGVEASNGEPGDAEADADGPSTLDGYALADEAAVSDRIRDPAAALSSFTVDDEADEPDGPDGPDGPDEPDEEEADDTGEVASGDAGDADDADDSGDADLGGTPLRGVDDADADEDDDDDGDGFEWGRVDDSA